MSADAALVRKTNDLAGDQSGRPERAAERRLSARTSELLEAKTESTGRSLPALPVRRVVWLEDSRPEDK